MMRTMSNPRNATVLIGTPITTAKEYKLYCLEEYFCQLRALSYEHRTVMLLLNGDDDGECLLGQYADLNIQRIGSESTAVATVVKCRNLMRQRVIVEGFDYLLFLEQDIVAPADLIQRLLAHGRQVCSALYYNQRADSAGLYDRVPMAWTFESICLAEGIFRPLTLNDKDLLLPRLIQVHGCGLGACLIHRSVLEVLEFQYEPGTPPVLEEYVFARECYKRGIEICLDVALECVHHSARGIQ